MWILHIAYHPVFICTDRLSFLNSFGKIKLAQFYVKPGKYKAIILPLFSKILPIEFDAADNPDKPRGFASRLACAISLE